MADYDAADGCIISKSKEENEASSQAATQPCDDLSESLCNSFAEQDRSYEEDRVSNIQFKCCFRKKYLKMLGVIFNNASLSNPSYKCRYGVPFIP